MKFRLLVILVVASLAGGAVLGNLVTRHWTMAANNDEPDALARATAAAEHMLRVQKQDGLFEYEIDLVSGFSSTDNSVVRQAGAAFSLGEFFAKTEDSAVKPALASAIDGLWSHTLAIESGALVSETEEIKGIKAGATALALLALLHYEMGLGETMTQFDEQRNQWLEGLLGLRIPAAGFQRSPVSELESPYYNGEIWLALAVFAQTHPDKLDPQFLQSVDRYMMARYGDELDKGFFHWGVMATSQRYMTTGQREYLDFGIKLAGFYLDGVSRVHPEYNSCYVVEGLASLAAVLDDDPQPGDAKTLQRITERVNREMEKNIAFQVDGGEIRTDRALIQSRPLELNAGAFRNGLYRYKTRIDFTQHCLSALTKQVESE